MNHKDGYADVIFSVTVDLDQFDIDEEKCLKDEKYRNEIRELVCKQAIKQLSEKLPDPFIYECDYWHEELEGR